MDFNNIKNTWKSSFDEQNYLSEEQINARLKIKSKSNTAIGRIKKSFKTELILGGVLYVFIISALFCLLNMPESLVFFVLISLLMLPSYFMFFKNFKKIKNVIYAENNLKQSLQKTTQDIDKFIIIGSNNLLKIITIPLATVMGMLIGIYISNGGQDIVETLITFKTKTNVKIILVFVFSILLVPITKKMFIFRFKQHHDELKEYLNGLEEISDN